jgi:hypothetical protein
MIRTSINLQPQNYNALRRAKEGTGLSQSVIINLALEAYFKQGILATIEATLTDRVRETNTNYGHTADRSERGEA